MLWRKSPVLYVMSSDILYNPKGCPFWDNAQCIHIPKLNKIAHVAPNRTKFFNPYQPICVWVKINWAPVLYVRNQHPKNGLPFGCYRIHSQADGRTDMVKSMIAEQVWLCNKLACNNYLLILLPWPSPSSNGFFGLIFWFPVGLRKCIQPRYKDFNTILWFIDLN